MLRTHTLPTALAACLLGCSLASAQESQPAQIKDRADEPYLKNVKQLTFGDERAGEAYYSPDGKELLFQAKRDGQAYYQIYRMAADGSGRRMVSTGKGKTTCAYFHPTKRHLFIYASSHLDTRTHKAPAKPKTKRKYKWDYDDSFDIFLADLRTGKIVKQLTTAKGYDAECSFSPDGTTIAFTSREKGHPDSIFLMNEDGTNRRPLVRIPGIDCGGPFFSYDGEWVIYRASAKGSRTMQVYMTSRDGKTTKQLTHASRINWAPFMHPNGKFASYAATAKGSYTDFDLFLVMTDGSKREVALTNHDAFDGLPAFSPDGKYIVWSSSRGGSPQVYRAELVIPPASAFKTQAKGGSAHGGGGAHGGGSNPHGGGANPHGGGGHGGSGGHGAHGGGHGGHGGATSRPTSQPTSKPTSRPAKSPHGSKGDGQVRPMGKPMDDSALARLVPGIDSIKRETLLLDVRRLADDSMMGRKAGTQGERDAASYLSKRLASLGVRPAGADGSWLEPFSYAKGGQRAKTGNALNIKGQNWTLDTDFRPLLYSGSGKVQGLVALAGYGIRAEEHGYDDLEKIDLKGKVALVMTGGPKSQRGGAFDKDRPGVYQDLRYKIATVRDAGASAVLIVRSKGEGWLRLSSGDPGLPVLQVTRAALQKRLGLDLRPIMAGIDMYGAASSKDLGVRCSLGVKLVRPKVESQNVVGRITGTQLPDEVIVIGAHYDHLGMGGEGSLAAGVESIHNGADDNASGCAGMLALAEALIKNPPRRTVLFVGFGAEEQGLIGSKAFVKDPPIGLGRVIAMLNMDMIGRAEGRPLLIGGTGSSPEWRHLLQRTANFFGKPFSTQADGFGPSDHASFYAEGIPVLFLWTGTHVDYHKPSDDLEKIDAAGLEHATKVALTLVRGIDGFFTRPAYRKVPRKSVAKRVVTGEKGAYFGSVPNYAQDGIKGVLLDGARTGTPADKAGIKKGDVVIEFAGNPINNIYDYTNALRLVRPGQKITVKVRREGKVVELKATLGGR